jgi:hypothetical protein
VKDPSFTPLQTTGRIMVNYYWLVKRIY